ncbi:MAG: hemerythrin domain-containing protein [Planctomycetaceae bacterium]|nr:hemerythrin domain-containing protein [Planctomycetaceae bacterium]
MPDSRLKALKATMLLKEDHKKVKELLVKYGDLSSSETEQKEDLFAMIRAELNDHATIEEEIFYPAVSAAEAPDAEESVQEAEEEHKIVRVLLDEMSELSPGEIDFEAKMKVLKENVLHHAEEEEKTIFPLFKKLPREIQDEISERLRERKSELTDGFGD